MQKSAKIGQSGAIKATYRIILLFHPEKHIFCLQFSCFPIDLFYQQQ
jgi:hypothetical protein